MTVRPRSAAVCPTAVLRSTAVEENSSSLTWEAVRDRAVRAVEAALVRLVREGKGELLADTPVGLPPNGRRLEVWITIDRRWVDQQFYVVDADLGGGLPAERHPVELARVEGKKLLFTVPPATHAALGGARAVRVFVLSGIDIKLKRALLGRLKASTRGDLIEQLWTAERDDVQRLLTTASPDSSLNLAQQAALAAMTGEGAVFVWGPPGTGKTKVITAAVRDAVGRGRTVLIASHTHVAVDNVLENLIRSPGAADLLRPGVAVRVASAQTQDKVSSAVTGHDFLIIDKAAAVLTNRDSRREALDHRRQVNRDHPARQALVERIEATAEIDVDRVQAARRAVAAAEEISVLEHERAGLDRELTAAVERVATQRELARLRSDVARVEAVAAEASEARHLLELEWRAAEARMTAHAERRQWGWAAKKRRREGAALEARRLELEAELLRAKKRSDGAEGELRRAREALAASSAVGADASPLDGTADAGAAARATEQRAVQLRGAIARAASALDGARCRADSVPGAKAIVDDARQRGLLEQLDERDRLNDVVAGLDAERRDIERDNDLLEDDMRATRASLVAESQVVACTLASLTTHPALIRRRFDVVIIDEVANADPAAVVYAGSRADQALALVGDFLQNSPIADVDDPTTPDEELQAAWQELDIFGLAGIRSRATAEGHPRCVALRVQYRFPSVIAELVNAFCYDGMLKSNRISAPGDGPVITLVDTSRHIGYQLRRDGTSWHSPLGLDILTALARRAGDEGGGIGFVTPYRVQADRAERRMRKERLPVECGTSHRFQGREYDTVILDLMQDGTERWVALADLAGARHAVSAAKLLNVAITRARKRLYLVGDWDFIRRHDSPGMSALAALEGHDNFEVVDASQVYLPLSAGRS